MNNDDMNKDVQQPVDGQAVPVTDTPAETPVEGATPQEGEAVATPQEGEAAAA